MSYHLKSISIFLFCFIAYGHSYAQDSSWQRTYEFGAYTNFDLRNSSRNAIGVHRVLNDGFNSLIASRMKPKAANISRGVFSFATTYLTMLWSHELGHSLRAKQVGGNFNIHNFNLPIPYTTVDLPAQISLENEAIFVTAGFEVNYLNIRTLQGQFIRQNGLWNEDLALSFANRLMYPIYSNLIVPVNPKDKQVWIETAGDPIHYILPVFKNFSGNQVFMQDSSVNPDLVAFYNQSSIFATLFQLIDPQFYREVGAAFGKSTKTRRPIFLVGDYKNGWTYGTLFNASPLGYELYWQNYLHLKGRQYSFYFKYGRPFQNIGFGVSMHDIFNKQNNLQVDALLETWQQAIFGNGISAEVMGRWKFSKHVGLNFNLGYKTRGYLLGKQLSAGPNLGAGICIYRN